LLSGYYFYRRHENPKNDHWIPIPESKHWVAARLSDRALFRLINHKCVPLCGTPTNKTGDNGLSLGAINDDSVSSIRKNVKR
jgi:hypothetical protein